MHTIRESVWQEIYKFKVFIEFKIQYVEHVSTDGLAESIESVQCLVVNQLINESYDRRKHREDFTRTLRVLVNEETVYF
jgi:hypothetical protein